MPPATKLPPTQAEINVILDSNIIQYLTSKFVGVAIKTYLGDLITSAHVTPNISEITISETLSGATATQETEVLSYLSQMKLITVNQQVLVASARLLGLYKQESIDDNQINLGDRIIAATSIITGFPILTANMNDFPRPFFREAHDQLVSYKKKNKTETIYLQILTPNTELIIDRFNHRK